MADRALGNPLGNPLGLARVAGPSAAVSAREFQTNSPISTGQVDITYSIEPPVDPKKTIIRLTQTYPGGVTGWHPYRFHSLDAASLTLRSEKSYLNAVKVHLLEFASAKKVHKVVASLPPTTYAGVFTALVNLPEPVNMETSLVEVVFTSGTTHENFLGVTGHLTSPTQVTVLYQTPNGASGSPQVLIQVVDGGFK